MAAHGVCVCVRETDRQTDRQRGRDRERQKEIDRESVCPLDSPRYDFGGGLNVKYQ